MVRTIDPGAVGLGNPVVLLESNEKANAADLRADLSCRLLHAFRPGRKCYAAARVHAISL